MRRNVTNEIERPQPAFHNLPVWDPVFRRNGRLVSDSHSLEEGREHPEFPEFDRNPDRQWQAIFVFVMLNEVFFGPCQNLVAL